MYYKYCICLQRAPVSLLEFVFRSIIYIQKHILYRFTNTMVPIYNNDPYATNHSMPSSHFMSAPNLTSNIIHSNAVARQALTHSCCLHLGLSHFLPMFSRQQLLSNTLKAPCRYIAAAAVWTTLLSSATLHVSVCCCAFFSYHSPPMLSASLQLYSPSPPPRPHPTLETKKLMASSCHLSPAL